jgi:hypothetical protein
MSRVTEMFTEKEIEAFYLGRPFEHRENSNGDGRGMATVKTFESSSPLLTNTNETFYSCEEADRLFLGLPLMAA